MDGFGMDGFRNFGAGDRSCQVRVRCGHTSLVGKETLDQAIKSARIQSLKKPITSKFIG